MSIFSNDNIVVGLFDSMSDTDKIVETLHRHDFGDDVRVIDKTSLESNLEGIAGTPVLVEPASGSGSPPGVPLVPDAEGNIAETRARTKKYVQDELTSAGVDEDQAAFYAERVARGSALVMVETDGSRVAEAKNIMDQSDRVSASVSS